MRGFANCYAIKRDTHLINLPYITSSHNIGNVTNFGMRFVSKVNGIDVFAA